VRFPSGTGLILSNATTVIPSNSYTVVVLFKFDTVAGYRRILDMKNGSPDQGLYTYSGQLYFYPGAISSTICVTNDTWHQVVVTRDLPGQVVVYSDGVQQLTYNDAPGSLGIINASNTIRFFKDNAAEESAGSVARIRLFTCALSAAEVAALDRVPAGPTILLSDWALDPAGRFYFKITGPAAPLLRVQRSEDLSNWSTVNDILSFPGVIWVTNPPAPPADNRAFRAMIP
jgi:hypothetical protein